MSRRLARRALAFQGRHTQAIVTLLSVALVIALVVAVLGWNEARQAQKRVTSVETQLETERIGKNIADVTTCFNRAYGRPALVTIFRVIAGVAADTTDRAVISEAIADYNRDTPTEMDCVRLARERGIDPKPYIKDPPLKAGNTTGR